MRRSSAGREWMTAVATVAGLAAPAAAQTVYPESAEPNDTKAQATIVAGLVHGDRITGLTRGALPNGGVSSPDYFLVSPAPMAPGIYRHQLDLITTPINGLSTTLRGLDQNAMRQILAGTDVQIASGLAGTVVSSTWYGFGRAERAFLRIQGGPTSPAYTLAFSTAPVAVSQITPVLTEGAVTILIEGTFGNPDAEFWVYNANLNPVAGATNDDPVAPLTTLDRASVTRHLPAGVYHLVVGVANIANHLASPIDELTPADDDVLDFAGAVVPAGGMPVSRFGDLTISDQAGSVTVPQVPLTTTGRWFRFEVRSACTAAVVASGPASASVCASQSITMSSVATGSEPIGYQWLFNGQGIPGATGPSYTISSVSFAHAGEYAVRASNACGQAVSAGATLTVHPFEPDIIEHPKAQVTCIGGTASFSVVAAGHMGGALSYQWRHDGVAIPWAHGPVHEFTTSVADAGTYDCIVSEQGCGWAQTEPADLSFYEDPPRIKLNGPETMIVQAPVQQYQELGAVAADDCDASVPVVIGGHTVNSMVPGQYVVAYNATDSQGLAAATVYRYVTVADAQRPAVQASVSKFILWPPNHTLVNVGLAVQASDSVDAAVSGASARVRVFCDETELPGTGDGTGMHSPDAKGIKAGTLRLRSERQGSGDGRVYLIMSSAEDASGNIGFAFATVVIPHANTAASVAAVKAQAGGLMAKAKALAQAATTEKAVTDGLAAAGLCEHGAAAACGPNQ